MLIHNRPLLIAIVLFVVLVVLLIITAGTSNIAGVPSIIGGIMEPVQGAFYTATEGIVSFFNKIFSQSPVELENEQLLTKVQDLTGQLTDYNELKLENERLKALLDYRAQNAKYKTVTAQVTGRTPGQWFVVFTINVGVSKGVMKDMAVINSSGLVGRVIDTGASWAKVMAIIDPESSVAGIVERTRDNGMIKGTLQNEGDASILMEFLPFDADLMPGDKVITSGLGGVFPKGLEIGSVLEVTRGRDNSQTNAKLKPSVDFLHLEEVMVIVLEEESN